MFDGASERCCAGQVGGGPCDAAHRGWTRRVDQVWKLRRLAAGLVCLALCAGCGVAGGEPEPAGYSCREDGRHCYAKVVIGPTDCGTASNPCLTGFATTITFTDHVSPGNGFLTHEIWLSSYGCNCWIEMGWLSSSLHARPVIFWAQATGDPATHTATLGRANIVKVVEPTDGNSGRFSVVYEGNNTFRIRIVTNALTFETTTVNTMWSGRDHGYVEMGSELEGSQGAFSSVVSYSLNRAFFAPTQSEFIPAWPGMGAVADKPPYGGWAAIPGGPNLEGGVFIEQCCA